MHTKTVINRENSIPKGVTDYLPEQARSLTQGRYFLALPHKHNTDGFFAARMKKAARP